MVARVPPWWSPSGWRRGNGDVTTIVLRYRDGHGNVTVMGTKEGKWADIRKWLDKEPVKEITPPTSSVPREEVPVSATYIEGGVAKHDCPSCGAAHRVKVYKDRAEKQKAYRKRKQ